MRLLLARLPQTTVVSVGHRRELEAYHTRKLTLARRHAGARLVSDDGLGRTSFQGMVSYLIRRLGGSKLTDVSELRWARTEA